MAEKFTLPDLPYDYAALEPHISAQIMQLHHDKHHNTYVTGANTALEKMEDLDFYDNKIKHVGSALNNMSNLT